VITRIFDSITFLLFVLWELLITNLQIAWMVIQPPARLDAMLYPQIIAYPLKATRDLEIITLATVITLTPGTLSVDLDTDDKGQKILYIHNMQKCTPEEYKADVENRLERRILQITRGRGSAIK